MQRVQKAALWYVVLRVVLLYGYAIGRFQVFPHAYIEPLVQDFQAFATGDPTEQDRSIVQKLKNDLGISFDRWLFHYPPNAIASAAPVEGDVFPGRPEPPWVYVDPAHRQGYRVVAGAMQLPDTFWGALLLDPQGRVVHSWRLTTQHLSGDMKDQLKTLYGVHVFEDGSIIFTMQEDGGGLVKVDACSNVVWSREGLFHHAVSPDEHGYFWTFTGSQKAVDQDLARVSVATGEIDRVIRMPDVRAANPDLRIWELQGFAMVDMEKLRQDGNMTHGNDVDPLPSTLADAYPGFAADDLAISYATPNLVFVLNPDTLKVEWWRVGISGFQHDVDWEPDGRLAIFSNNPRSGPNSPSSIVTVRPADFDVDYALRGEDIQFSNPFNGQHELTPFGTRMVSSSMQGWAFEVDDDNNIVFSFVNNVNAEKRQAMHIGAAWRFGEDYFEEAFWQRCSKNG